MCCIFLMLFLLAWLHLQVLLLWGAHVNVQRVTQTAWSRYLLKYTLKVCTCFHVSMLHSIT